MIRTSFYQNVCRIIESREGVQDSESLSIRISQLSGASLDAVGHWRRSGAMPFLPTIKRLAKALHVPLEELLKV